MLYIMIRERNGEGLAVTTEPGALAKTNRINLLFDFYEPLLTEKQQTFLKYYYHDDFSLGEIAAEFDISRQAVYEHVKRAEGALEGYETKLGLMASYQREQEWLARLAEAIGTLPEGSGSQLAALLQERQTSE
ncbi:YlxM family DNA-binding protein [Paenibacillus daejeonensis]|uniref:YlxM family DNA-binding protein n=1 Tax=Paenibacillus daejeonensis TaxID=135193 RepID=UPI00035F1974